MEKELGGLREGWKLVLLDTISEDISYGYTASSVVEPIGPKMLRITDIQNNTVNWQLVPYCQIDEKKKPQYLMKAGDLVFARTGATVGKSYLIKNDVPDSVYASYLIRVRCNSNVVIEFLSHFFNAPTYWQQITDFSAGIGQPNVNGTKLKGLLIPLAGREEQKIIADKLDSLLAQVDSIKTRLDQIPQILKRFRQAVLSAAVNGKLIADRWGADGTSPKQGKLSSYVSIDIGHAFKSKEFCEQGIALLRGQNIEPGSLRWEDTKYFSETKLDIFSHLFINEGDVILAMDRPIVSAGLKLARAKKEDLPCVLVQRVARFKEYRNMIPDYLYLLLSDVSFSNYIQPHQTGSDIPHISGKQILDFNISIPPLEEQNEIVARVEKLFAWADNIEKQVNNAQQRVNNLTQSILAKAFRGELTEQWRKDNPQLISGENSAAALLEKIKTERAAQTKKSKKKA